MRGGAFFFSRMCLLGGTAAGVSSLAGGTAAGVGYSCMLSAKSFPNFTASYSVTALFRHQSALLQN